ncbi:MAG: hypothetical protein Q7R67_00680 [bacterium]|nr:hypothetical protein [bacterium]
MKHYFLIALSLFAFVALGSWMAISLGLYNSYWYTDVILHVVAGAGFGFVWLALNHKIEKRRFILILGAASFAVLGSVGWELWEFVGWRIMSYDMPFYIPELGDSLGDICCGLLGGVLSVMGKIRKG